MEDLSFSVFPNENFLDLRLYQYGWEQCAPLHSYGPSVRNHYLFHYVISGKGWLDSTGANGVTKKIFSGKEPRLSDLPRAGQHLPRRQDRPLEVCLAGI